MSRKPVFWISGNQRQCRETWQQILDHVQKSSGEMPNVEILFCGINPASVRDSQRWTTTNELIQLLRNQDLFDDRSRIIKVIGLPEEHNSITPWLRLVTGCNILVFWGPFGYIKPGTKRFISAKTGSLYKTIKKNGRIYEYPINAKTDSDAIYCVRQISAEYKKELSFKSAQRMVQLQGRKLDLLANSVSKLSIYQTGKEISLEDVEACCFSDYLDEVWNFIDHLDKQEIEPAINYLQKFYVEGKGSTGESFYGRVSRFFGALLQHYLFLLLLKDVCGRTLNTVVAQQALSAFKKTTPSKIKELISGVIAFDDLECRFSKSFVEKNIEKIGVKRVFARRKGEVYEMVADLYNCMYWARRYSSDDAMIRLCLDTFVLVVCKKISVSQAAQIRGGQRKTGV